MSLKKRLKKLERRLDRLEQTPDHTERWADTSRPLDPQTIWRDTTTDYAAGITTDYDGYL